MSSRTIGFLLICFFLPAYFAWGGERELPEEWTLQEMLSLFRVRGLDLLLADAAVLKQRGEGIASAALSNPQVSFVIGPTINHVKEPGCSGCVRENIAWGISDQGALSSLLTGKQALKKGIAQGALWAMQWSRRDAQRHFEFILKTNYHELASAQQEHAFLKELHRSLTQLVALYQAHYPGTIDRAELDRMEIEKLEVDQALVDSQQQIRKAQVELAQLLGVQTQIPSFRVKEYSIPHWFASLLEPEKEQELLKTAMKRRPDRFMQSALFAKAVTALHLGKRERIPEIELGMGFNGIGYGQDAPSPPYLAAVVSTSIPVFYQRQGEIERAAAGLQAQAIEQAKNHAQIVWEVHAALVAFRAFYERMERMRSEMIPCAKTARDRVEMQYKQRAVSLIDVLDAQRQYIKTHFQYLEDVQACWSAMHQIEYVVGIELGE
ncbi:TolC family protein [Pajaroellobacter abortibovis]|uniref:Transporter n=1 Tax=Pajaroellobacter abortibovis TaxID=1882918 RepID=A0A1L6MV21_9BACT|nr:TolC family protein [Pajaroellobacter abortibovis]APR99359.1 hypothetical protein BCY86_00700 [Pajaroellobacter abortibovis]